MLTRIIKRFWPSGGLWLPSCYCHECGNCAHYAEYRFPFRHYWSCRECLACRNSAVLWDVRPNWTGRAPSSAHFQMSAWYKLRHAAAGFVQYLAGVWIAPKDPKPPSAREDVPCSSR